MSCENSNSMGRQTVAICCNQNPNSPAQNQGHLVPRRILTGHQVGHSGD